MKCTINNKLINSLKPREKPFEIRDSIVSGLVLRVLTSGVMTWYLNYKRGKWIKLGRVPAMTPAQARDMAKEWLADVYRGEDPIETKRKAQVHTLKSFVQEYHAPWIEANTKRPKAYLKRIERLYPTFGDLKLNEIHPFLVEKWRHERYKAGIKSSTINRDITDLKACLQKAVNWGFIELNPISKVKKAREDQNGKVRFLTLEEEARLKLALENREQLIRKERESANEWRRIRRYKLLDDYAGKAYVDHLKPMIILSLHTGMRQGEVFSLQWDDIIIEKALLTVAGDRAKSGKTRHIPLNEEALETLLRWKVQLNDSSGLVFPGEGGNQLDNVKKGWAAILKDAKITNFRWHDLRHTFASNLTMAGVDLNTVRELLGHSDYKMTLRYAHLAPEHKAEAVAKLLNRTPMRETLNHAF